MINILSYRKKNSVHLKLPPFKYLLFIQNLFPKHQAIAAAIAAIVEQWNVEDRPYQALS